MIYYVYVLYNKTSDRFYIGYSINLKQRLIQHSRSKLYHHNKKHELIYFEGFTSKLDARKREVYLKSTKGRRALKLMLKYTLTR